MYAVAARLDPDSYFELATATYREMLRPGSRRSGSSTTCTTIPTGAVRRPQRDGAALNRRPPRRRNPDPCWTRATSAAVRRAAVACRRGSPTALPTRWAERVAGPAKTSAPPSTPCEPSPTTSSPLVAAAARAAPRPSSEQVAENDAASRHTASRRPSCSRTHGVLGPLTAPCTRPTSPTPTSGTSAAPHHACFCPTTERDLADGIGPAGACTSAAAPDSGLRQPRRDRPVRGDARGRTGRATRLPASAATGPPPSCSRRDRRRSPPARVRRRRRDRGRAAPTSSPSTSPARGPPAPAPREPPSSRPPPPTSSRSSWTARSSSPGRRARHRPRARRHDREVYR